jgi:homoserine kinase type II
MTSARLASVHGWMTRAVRLPFVPALLTTATGHTLAQVGGRVWDATRWVSGSPLSHPTAAEVGAAGAAVARLHAVWAADRRVAPAPGVLNRLRVLAEGRTFAPSHLRAGLGLPPELRPVILRACEVVSGVGPVAESDLRPWENVPLPVQPCVRDLRGEHVLFSGPSVTGVVDFGAMAEDTPAVDVARMLGDLAGDDEGLFAAGLHGYRAAGGNSGVTDELVRVLDRAGVVCSVVGWLVRLLVERRSYPDPAAVATRLGHLLTRATGVPPGRG